MLLVARWSYFLTGENRGYSSLLASPLSIAEEMQPTGAYLPNVTSSAFVTGIGRGSCFFEHEMSFGILFSSLLWHSHS